MDSFIDVKLHLLDYWRVVRVRFGLIFLIFFLVVLTAGITTFLTPKVYRSFTTVELQPDMTPVKIFAHHENVDTSLIDSNFFETQFAIITRKSTLYPVIESLHLEEKWADKNGILPKTIA
jgi:polysaccharide biosynthesis transport protein